MGRKIYLSGPLFSRAEIEWGRRVKAFLEERLEGIEEGIEILWPHEIPAGSAEEIFQANLQAMNQCDLMVAMLDGPQVDDGTAWEIGYFFSSGKRVLGLRTDLRHAGEFEASRVNLMVECSCVQIASSLEGLAAELKGLLC